jgi:hypothetical protein
MNCIYFALGFNTSYVAEWRGGGPHDLLRGFDSFRNCFDRFLWQQWLDLKPGGVFTLPFFYGSASGRCFSSARQASAPKRRDYPGLSQFLKGIDQVPLVEESCEALITASLFCSSGRIFPASCLPSSTPHWSNVKMSQMTPWTKILCSYKAISSPRLNGVISLSRKELVGRLPLNPYRVSMRQALFPLPAPLSSCHSSAPGSGQRNWTIA